MSEDVGAIAQMVIDMREETELRVALDTAVESIFRRQFRESFGYPGGPLKYWIDVEAEWKHTTHGAPIPTKYRTNKSVIVKAYNTQSLLTGWMDADDEVFGKSAIQHKLSAKGVITKEGAFKKIIHIIDTYAEVKGHDEARELCRELHIKIGELI